MSKPQSNLDVQTINSPISNVSDDVLWAIFGSGSIMTEETEKTAPVFQTLLSSSQVCSRWRGLINSSSFLWGRVVNLKYLMNPEWREEVMRRTGNASLSVTADLRLLPIPTAFGTQSPQLQPPLRTIPLIAFLSQYWNRLRYVNVRVTGDNVNYTAFLYNFHHLLVRPATVLEHFVLDISSSPIGRQQMDLTLTNMFSNQAPLLRKFNAPNVIISLATPWLQHIRDFGLSVVTSVDKLLQVLPSMPRLETLRDMYGSITCSMSSSPLRKVQATQLRNIVVNTKGADLQPYLDLFTHIAPSEQCSVQLSMHSSGHPEETLKTLSYSESAADILRVLPDFCGLSKATYAQLSSRKVNAEYVVGISLRGNVALDVGFNTKYGDPDRARLHSLLQTATNSIRVNGVQTLSFYPTNDTRVLFSDLEIFDRICWTKVLRTSAYGIQCLVDLEKKGCRSAIVLPALQTIELDGVPRAIEIPSIKIFLASRMSESNPNLTKLTTFQIPVNDLAPYVTHLVGQRLEGLSDERLQAIRHAPSIAWLQQYTGLKVVLDFRENARRQALGMPKLEILCTGSEDPAGPLNHLARWRVGTSSRP